MTDETKHAAQARALLDSEEGFRLLIESVREYAIFMLDSGGYVASWNAGFSDLMPPRILDDAEVGRWTGELANGRGQWWVAEGSSQIVGFVGVGPSRDPLDAALGELDTIAVDPSHWRAGVGRALMSVALEALAQEGFREAIVWTLAGYERGHSFYGSTGWVADGTTRDGGRQTSFRHHLRRSTAC